MNSLGQNPAGPMSERSFLARQWDAACQVVADFWARNALRRQFADLDRRGGLDELLTDIGLSRPELDRIIESHPETGRLMLAMTRRLGVDADKLDPKSRYQVGRSCAVCNEHGRCRHWLKTASPESTEYREFCPNAAVFDAALEHVRKN